MHYSSVLVFFHRKCQCTDLIVYVCAPYMCLCIYHDHEVSIGFPGYQRSLRCGSRICVRGGGTSETLPTSCSGVMEATKIWASKFWVRGGGPGPLGPPPPRSAPVTAPARLLLNAVIMCGCGGWGMGSPDPTFYRQKYEGFITIALNRPLLL